MPSFLIQIIALVLSGVCLIALMVVLGALFPKWVRHTHRSAAEHPRRAFLIGLVNFLFFSAGALGFVLLARNTTGIFVVPGLIFAIPLGVGLTLGAAGMVELAGERLFPGQTPIARTVLSTALLYIACLTPFAGWFGLTAYLGISGLGAFILGFFRKAPPPLSAEPQIQTTDH